MSGYKFKLLKRGYPLNHKNWFDYDSAVEFEETLFDSLNHARDSLINLCNEFGTLDDPNFTTKSPLVVEISVWNTEMGEDADLPFSW